MIDTSGKKIIERFIQTKEKHCQRLILDMNSESDEIKYSYNAVLKMLIGEIDNLAKTIIQEERIELANKLSEGSIEKKKYEGLDEELKQLDKNVHLVKVNTKIK